MAKEVLFKDEARASLLKGIDTVANAVRITIGARGRNVIIDRDRLDPLIINDGVTIAKEIELEHPLENAGAKLIKQVCSNANDIGGDGSTTACILAQAIIHEGLNLIEAGNNPIQMKKGIEIATKMCIEELDRLAVTVEDNETIKKIATISAGGNEFVGNLIAEAMEEVGADGTIAFEETCRPSTSLKIVKGMEFNQGYVSKNFCVSDQQKEIILNDPLILIINDKISSFNEIVEICQQVAEAKRSLLILSDDLEAEPLETLLLNNLKEVLTVVAVKVPYFDEKRANTLEDIAISCGTKVFSHSTGTGLNGIDIEQLGNSKSITVSKDKTLIIPKENMEETIKARAEFLKLEIKLAESTYEKETLQDRLARLSGGVALIQIGADSDAELKELKYRIEDAVNATRASMEEGIVAGGGVALIEVMKRIAKKPHNFNMAEITKGFEIIMNSLDRPLFFIAENCGVDGEKVIDNVLESDLHYGYDAVSGEYVNMFDKGIIDPVKVTKSALRNASSVASIFLTTEVAIFNKKGE